MPADLRKLVAAVGLTAVLGLACNGRQLPADSPDPQPTSEPTMGTGGGSAAGGGAIGPQLSLVDPVAVGLSEGGITSLCDDNLKIARDILAAIKSQPADPSALTFASTLGRLDDAFLSIYNGSELPFLIGVAHPDETVRRAARACETKTDELMTSIYLDAELAAIVKAYAEKKEQLTPERQRFLDHTLRDFRRNGIELDAAGQKRLREINTQMTELGQHFTAEISASKGIVLLQPVQLTGLPDAYIKSHPPAPDGKVEITTDYPDYYPFVKYALDREAAKQLYIKFVNRGGVGNVGRLDKLLALRYEKAQLLGYDTWADYAIEPRMAKDAAAVRAFLQRVSAAIKPAVDKELAEFKTEFVSVVKNPHRPMSPADRYFLTERLQEKRFNFDSKELANYFEIKRVTQGLLDITAKMYGVEYKTVTEAAWHPDVTVHEVWSNGELIGKFYLDLHPRPHKYKHAAMFNIRTAKVLADGTRQTPIAALICNFPRPGEAMPHDQVVTYFHEFGHVLHHLLTKTELASFAGTNTVRDFVETPSQMFEEWAWSREVLDLFARHLETGEKIPDALFQARAASRKFGMALATERQIFLAMLDLEYHSREPGFDTNQVLQEIHDKHFSFTYVKGTHFQSSFGHLISYDAGYYGYQWALALAHDVLSRFQDQGLFHRPTAQAWRDGVLAMGGSRDPHLLVRDFLGREPSEEAYVRFLKE